MKMAWRARRRSSRQRYVKNIRLLSGLSFIRRGDWPHAGICGGCPPLATGGAETSRQGSAIKPRATSAPGNMLALIPEEFLSPSYEATATRRLSRARSKDDSDFMKYPKLRPRPARGTRLRLDEPDREPVP